MDFSYWENKTWLSNIDFAVIGSGIVGLNCALSLRKRYPISKIVIFERGILPSGASTKNAGFACFGSISEILEDLKNHSEEVVVQLVKTRVEGLQLLRRTLGDAQLDYRVYGGYELFTRADSKLFETCISRIESVNELLEPVFNAAIFSEKENHFGFKNIEPKLIYSKFEGQIDTGRMMLGLIKKASAENILILNSSEITDVSDNTETVSFQINSSLETSAKKVFIATNGFAKQFLNEDISPARAQVLVTKSIENLKIKGTFHLDKGYYYFRNIDDRILFGGGRNLDFEAEKTTELGLTLLVQDRLEEVLKTVILPNYSFEIDQRWSGIMGMGKQKKPIVKAVSENVFCGVRLGGMAWPLEVPLGSNFLNSVNGASSLTAGDVENTKEIKTMIKKIFRFILKLFLLFIGLTVLWVLIYKFVPVPFTPLMAIRSVEGGKNYETRHDWVSIDEISPYLQLAVICAEDQSFLSHGGFDRAAIEKAMESNEKGKKLRGGSTISQQTAKNAFLWPNRSWFRKGMEAYFTVLIEALWSKERILEVYLNSVEMGGGVFGAEAASQYWFHRSAKDLRPSDAAAIAAILPSPRRYKANPPGPYVARRTQWIVRQMRYYGPFTLEKQEPKEVKQKKKKK